MVILQVNYRRPDIPAQEWNARYTDESVKPFVNMRGLKWKIWIDEPTLQLSGGIYLFETRADADAYLQGPIISGMRGNPDRADLSLRVFEIRDHVSRLTRAPLDR